MSLIVKICGLSTPEALDVALDAGADMVGFVFFPPSPRNLSFKTAAALESRVRGQAKKVALSVDADDTLLAYVVDALGPDILQLHGRETPSRVAEIREKFGRPAMKAIGVATAADFAAAAPYNNAADFLLFDAKPPKGAALPGGNGRAFDWRMAQGFSPKRPWLLSGGLDPDNVAEAIAETGAIGVDVSSGVESAPGIKDETRIRAFIAAAREAFQRAAEGVE